MAAPAGWDTRDLAGLAFACLEGCGFCCTFPPEVAHDELARLRARLPRLPVVPQQGGGQRLALQSGCGGCTLLSRRRCTAYDDRPRHCRYFPFHVYFGRRTEAYANRTCRGVAAAPGGDLLGGLQAQVLGVARPHDILEGERLARRVHARFQEQAVAAGAWGDVDAATARLLADPERVRALAAQPAAAADAWAPFEEPDVVARPFHLTADLRWLTFAPDGEGRLQALEMQETGDLRPGPRLRLEPNEDGDHALALAELRRLARRDLWAGAAFDVVDAADYQVGVEDAAALRVAAQGADLLLRLRVLRALGLPVDGDELARFADSAALDAPTIGGWL